MTINGILGIYYGNSLLLNDGQTAVPVAVPVWFVSEGYTSGENEGDINWVYSMTPTFAGTFVFDVEIYEGETLIDTVEFTIIIVDNFDYYEICCKDDNVNIAWLNTWGGWRSYVFEGMREYRVELGDSKTYKTNGVVRYSERTNVYDGITAFSKLVPKHHIDYIDSLKQGIQAYLYNNVTENWDIPILITENSYSKYTSKKDLYQLSVSFIIATEKQIQTQ